MFGSLKSFHYTECAVFINKHMGKNITRYEICQMTCKAHLKSMTPINKLSGFKKTDIFPLSLEKVPMQKLLPYGSFGEKSLQKAKAMKDGKEAVAEYFKQSMTTKQIMIKKDKSECTKKVINTKP
jgi:hypothetical protein